MEDPVTIVTIGNGVLVELFDRELERVVSDILDLNSEAKAIRTISIKVAIKPDENRNFGQVGIAVSSSIGKPKPFGSTMYFGKKNGKIIAVEATPKQSQMFDPAGPRPVIDFDRKTGEVREGASND